MKLEIENHCNLPVVHNYATKLFCGFLCTIPTILFIIKPTSNEHMSEKKNILYLYKIRNIKYYLYSTFLFYAALIINKNY